MTHYLRDDPCHPRKVKCFFRPLPTIIRKLSLYNCMQYNKIQYNMPRIMIDVLYGEGYFAIHTTYILHANAS